MIWLFVLGWLAGVVSTLGFGKWWSDRHKVEIDDDVARMIINACKEDEGKDNDERTTRDS